ncbi:MAG TPA: FxLYD domain-containing protein [Candidatus Paceibacterota bacterium]|nr:FxLYD domain-containing protein [Candidatus Paceibacterota bacterium]
MSTRRAKQVIYGAFYAILWFAVFAFIYYVAVRPALAPVPCAGPACGSENARALATSTIWSFLDGTQSATYLARVTNANPGFGAASFDYAFDFFDASGTVARTIEGSSFIYPNEVKYFVAPNYVPIEEPYASFDISNVQWVSSSSIGAVPRFSFSDVQAATGTAVVSVSGRITNNDIAAFRDVTVVVIFKDGAGNPAGASETELDSLAPGESAPFTVSYPAVPGVNPAVNELDAYALRPVVY